MQPLLLATSPLFCRAAVHNCWTLREQAKAFLPRPQHLRCHFAAWRCRSLSLQVITWQQTSPACSLSGTSSRRPRLYWTNDDNMRMELEPHVSTVQHTPEEAPTRYLPTRKALQQAGLTALVRAIEARGGMESMTNLMNAKVVPRQERGYEVRRGARMSEESRQRMREARQGKKHNPEVRAKIAASNRGAHRSEATKQKMRTARIAFVKAQAEAVAQQKAEAARMQAVAIAEQEVILPSSRRPRFYWKHDANMRLELEPHVSTVQHSPQEDPTRYLPTRKELLQAELTALVTAIATRGGVYSAAVMQLMNAKVIPRHQRQYEKPGVRMGALVPEQVKQRMSEAHKGKKQSPEVRAKMAASTHGKHHSEATKQKMSTVAKRKAAAIAAQKAEAARVMAEAGVEQHVAAASEEPGPDKAPVTKRNRRVWRSKTDAAVNDADEEPTQSKQIKSEAQVDRQPWQRKREGKTKRKRQADPEAAQGQSRGKTKTGRAVGATEMQHVVVELTNLKRDLKQWRSSTERKYGRSLSEEETLQRFPHIHKKMKRHTELQDFMRSLK